MASSTSFNDLDSTCLTHIFSFLSGQNCAIVACTSPFWRDAAQSADLWKGFVEREFEEESRKMLEASAEQSTAAGASSSLPQWLGCHREMYKKLHSLQTRSKKMWARLKGWCSENAANIGDSLQSGASMVQIEETEKELGVTLPEALKAIYREHDGQLLNYDQCLDDDTSGRIVHPDGSVFAGLFGGYSFYNHFVCTRMLPLKRMVKWTKWMRESYKIRERGSGEKKNPDEHFYVLFAASYAFNKVFFVDTRDASVHVWTVDRIHSMRASPQECTDGTLDGVLQWMEIYADRLCDGTYKITSLLDDGEDDINPHVDPSRGICLFPAKEPDLASALTNGVLVETSSLFAPELSMVSTTGNPTYTLAYSVQFRLLPMDIQSNSEPLKRVKLKSRHWSILDEEGKEISSVDGDAVIGKYPDLKSGAAPFRYQSCTRQNSKKGSMKGHFTFKDISENIGPICYTREPRGDGMGFNVMSPNFHTNVPDVIF